MEYTTARLAGGGARDTESGEEGDGEDVALVLSAPPTPAPASVCLLLVHRGPGASNSQPVSWSSPSEQHMIFCDRACCLCPSSGACRRTEDRGQEDRGAPEHPAARFCTLKSTSLPFKSGTWVRNGC